MFESIFTWLIANWIQVIGVLTGGGSVFFLAKNKAVLGWTLGIINAVFFVVLMAQAHLYADVTLNLYYFVTSGMGLYMWLRGGKDKTPLKVTHLDWKGWAFWLVMIAVGTYMFGTFLGNMTDASFPMIDSLTTVMSFVGQFLLARKIFENWYIWIAADVIDIGLYAVKGLWMVSALTGVYMVFCVMGIMIWRKLEQKEDEGFNYLTTGPGAPISKDEANFFKRLSEESAL